MQPTFELINTWPSDAERRRTARHCQVFKFRRSVVRWIMRTFRLYRHGSY